MTEPPPPSPEFRIAALEAELARERTESSRLRSLVTVLLDNNPDGVTIADAAGNTTSNPASSKVFGETASDIPMSSWSQEFGIKRADGVTPYPLEELPLVRAMRGTHVDEELLFARTPQRPEGFWIAASARPLPEGGAVTVFRDITERKRLEEDLAARNAELAGREAEKSQLIERLRLAVEQMSTPVLEVWDDVLALPVVGVVDTQRSAQMVEKLLAEVVDKRCKHVIVDLTGVDVIDTSTADRFIKMARAVELLGASCIITGIQPAVAQTLVELGVEFAGLSTQRNLKRALETCTAKIRGETRGRRATDAAPEVVEGRRAKR